MMVRGMAGSADIKEVKFSQFATHLEKGDFETINITDRKLTGVKKDGTKEVTYAPSLLEISWLEEKTLNPMLEEHKINLESEPPKSEYTLLNILPTLLMVVAMGFLFYFMMSQGGNKQAFQFGKNRARLYKNGSKSITFKDVAGLEEEKVELSEIVDFLRNPGKYTKLGARIPKGVLLVGSPGTGKTYISRATAGEAGVPFFTISGSDFVEMFVGVGASRVRDLFNEAKKNAPCIVFIDEIDAVGRRRGAGLGGGNDEREQTLNQLLVEMDGFDGNLGIIILAATNRPDVLDPALLRPGRFDRQITVSLPDLKGREAILRVHARNKKISEDVKLDQLAKRTPGFSGADLENVLNEAAILAVRENKDMIETQQIDEAIDRVMMGPAKKSRTYDDYTKKLVAYHEAGHAIVGLNLPDGAVVQKVTIIPRGNAGGYNLIIPRKERILNSRRELMDTITSYMGGRAAEEIFFDDITTGASSDIQAATRIAKDMVTTYGMSDLGPIQYNSGNDSVFLGRDYNSASNASSQVAYEIDTEVRKIIEHCHQEARRIISENREDLEKIANTLMDKETLTAEEIEELLKKDDREEQISEKPARRKIVRKVVRKADPEE